MSDDDETGAPPEDPQQLSRRTTPTWEVELLISSVAVFAMLQLPGWINTQLLALLPRLDTGLRMPVQTMMIYADGASVILAVTFIAQLLLRSQWIARVGMHSVFPDGVQWDKLRSGPILRSVEQRMARDPRVAIERADNRATIVFAVGVSLASVLLFLTLALLIGFSLLYFPLRQLVPAINPSLEFMAVVIALIGPWSLAILLDRLLGRHLRPGSRVWRATAAVLRAYAAIGFSNGSTPIGLLTSHVGERRMHIITAFAMGFCMSVAVFSMAVGAGGENLGSYGLFPHFHGDTDRALDAAHYDDQRDLLRDPPLPYIPSAVVRHAYLRLVVPYRPARDIAAQHKHCPEALQLQPATARNDALLACLAALHPVTLDGKPLAVNYFSGSDARANRPALVAMIDVRDLPPGEHTLQVARTPRVDRSDGDAASSDRIAFWR